MKPSIELYNVYYPYMVVALTFLAALGSVIGGLVVGISVALAPSINPKEGQDCSCNWFGGFTAFIGGCLVAMTCLWLGGKYIGAF